MVFFTFYCHVSNFTYHCFALTVAYLDSFRKRALRKPLERPTECLAAFFKEPGHWLRDDSSCAGCTWPQLVECELDDPRCVFCASLLELDYHSDARLMSLEWCQDITIVTKKCTNCKITFMPKAARGAHLPAFSTHSLSSIQGCCCCTRGCIRRIFEARVYSTHARPMRPYSYVYSWSCMLE